MIRSYQYNKEQGLVVRDGPKQDVPPNTIVWTDIEEPQNGEERVLQENYGFHPLAVEDCMKLRQRSKLDDYKDYFFVVVHAIDGDPLNKLRVREIGIFVGHDYMVTFHWDQITALTSVRERVEKNPDLMSRGIDYILYLVLDSIVDEYFPLTDRIDERFSGIENRLLINPSNSELNELSQMRKTLVEIRKIISPQREMVNALIRYEGIFIKDENRFFFMDIYDHLMRIFDGLDTYRELISGSLEIYLTVVSNKMNEIMKTLTVIATIVLPLTLITSLYGMNFKYMPELGWRYGYLWSIGLMAVTAAGFLYYFRKKGWF